MGSFASRGGSLFSLPWPSPVGEPAGCGTEEVWARYTAIIKTGQTHAEQQLGPNSCQDESKEKGAQQMCTLSETCSRMFTEAPFIIAGRLQIITQMKITNRKTVKKSAV